MKTIVVIPTYDEKDNVRPMADAVLSLNTPSSPSTPSAPSAPSTPSSLSTPSSPSSPSTPSAPSSPFSVEVLFVDDNSPDGTGAIVDEMSAKDPRIHCLHRTKKEGLGRAYIAGFEKALELGADLVVQMDCDFSHDPKDVRRLVEAAVGRDEDTASTAERGVETASTAGRGVETTSSQQQVSADLTNLKQSNNQTIKQSPDLVIGSRYVKGGATPGWPFKRRLISRVGGIFIRLVTGMPLRDPTGGFKCWKASTLRALDLKTVQSAGYSFQLEMNHRTWKRGLKIREIPIVFRDREMGYSKISPGIAVESIKIALKLRFA